MSCSKFQFACVICALCAVVLSACGGGDNRLQPYGWTRVGEPFDSITLELERKWNNDKPTDSVEGDVAHVLALAQQDAGNTVKMTRARYWNARLLFRKGEMDAGMEELQECLNTNDSAKYPYDHYRILWSMDLEDPQPSYERYLRLIDDIKFYKSVNDCYLLGGRYIDLGTLFNRLGDTRRGLQMLELADSCFEIVKWDNMLSGNRINKATVLCLSERKEEGEAMYRSLLQDSTILNSDGKTLCAIYNNLFWFAEDTSAVKSAYDIIAHDTIQKELQCFYEGIMSNNFAAKGMLDSALYYSDKSISKLGSVYDPGIRLSAYESRSNVMKVIGNVDSAFRYLDMAVSLSDTLDKEEMSAEILNAEILREILEQEHRADIEQRKHTTVFICIIFGVLVVAGIVAAGVYRRMQRQKLARVQTQLQLEQSQRQVLAMQLAMEEKDTLFNELSRDLNDLAEEGDISHKASIKLENSIKTHLGLEAERKGFVQTFTEVSPAFSRRLKERYPALSDADVRLASFIAVGLDNKHIARILSIRPDSVKQARWRLRTKLNLAGDESLDDIIAGFMDDCQ